MGGFAKMMSEKRKPVAAAHAEPTSAQPSAEVIPLQTSESRLGEAFVREFERRFLANEQGHTHDVVSGR